MVTSSWHNQKVGTAKTYTSPLQPSLDVLKHHENPLFHAYSIADYRPTADNFTQTVLQYLRKTTITIRF